MNSRANKQFYAGLVVLGCALLMLLLQLLDRVFYQEKLHLGVAVVFLSLGTALMASSRHSRNEGK